MSKYTPGPWRSEPCYRTGYTVWGGTDAVPVCVVDTQDDEGRFGTIKNEADARLIAAAPMMYEALKQIEPILARMYGPQATELPPMQIVRAAISKAEGA